MDQAYGSVSVGVSSPDDDPRVTTAAELLRYVFATLDVPLACRLWDGTEVHVGAAGESPCAVVFRSPAVVRRLLLTPSMLRFGEAFIDGEIDIEGDMFAAMDVGGHIECMHVPLSTILQALPRVLSL